MTSLIELIKHTIDEKKGENIRVFQFNLTHGLFDYMVIADTNNPRLMMAIKDYLSEAIIKENYPIHHIEGDEASDWILIDAYSVLIHLFLKESRLYYQLDDLWADKLIDHD
ncbi:MAG: ribosome silencing factor [Erysipelotrichaceae bacterium]